MPVRSATVFSARDALTPVRARLRRNGPGLRPGLGRAMLVGVAFLAAPVAAEICKYADAEGAVHYTNLAPEKGWKKLGCTLGGDDSPVQRSSSSGGAARGNGGSVARAAPSPANFPRVDAETQRGRDDLRRRVLSDELASEEKLLAEAKDAYAGGAPVPLPEEKADVEKYRARIARLRQSVGLHEKNIEALRKELAGIR